MGVVIGILDKGGFREVKQLLEENLSVQGVVKDTKFSLVREVSPSFLPSRMSTWQDRSPGSNFRRMGCSLPFNDLLICLCRAKDGAVFIAVSQVGTSHSD